MGPLYMETLHNWKVFPYKVDLAKLQTLGKVYDFLCNTQDVVENTNFSWKDDSSNGKRTLAIFFLYYRVW